MHIHLHIFTYIGMRGALALRAVIPGCSARLGPLGKNVKAGWAGLASCLLDCIFL